MKRIPILLALLGLYASAEIHTLATITGSGAKVALSTNTKTKASWIQIITDPGNTDPVYFGDSTVASGTGLQIAKGAGYNTPPCSSCVYSLAATYIYVSNNDKAYIAFGN